MLFYLLCAVVLMSLGALTGYIAQLIVPKKHQASVSQHSSLNAANDHPASPTGIGTVYRNVQRWRAQRFLRAHPSLTLEALRTSPQTAALAVRTLHEMQARGEVGPQRETFTYPNLAIAGYGTRPLQRAVPKIAPIALRRFGEIPPSRRALNGISDPLVNMQWKIGLLRPDGAHPHEKMPDPTQDQAERITAATAMFRKPNNELTWRPFCEMLIEDLLTFGAGPFEVQENSADARPLFLWPVDAQSIRINAAWHPGSEHYRYAQARGYLFNSMGTTDDVHLSDDELCYPRLNPRTSTPFGLGYLEVAFDAVNSFIGAFDYATRRASNQTPQFGIFLGENVTIDQVRVWQHYWENEIEGYGKVPILGGGRQPSVFNMQGTSTDALWLQWQEFLIRVVAMSFGLSPMKLGVERDVNRSTATVQAADDWSTVAPVANVLSDMFTHWVLWERLQWTDLEFTWVVKTADEMKQAEIYLEQYNMNCVTVDELRQAYERPPLDDGLGRFTKSQYESIFKTGTASMHGDSPALVTPFDDELKDNAATAEELAFVRELIRHDRHRRHGLAEVAT